MFAVLTISLFVEAIISGIAAMYHLNAAYMSLGYNVTHPFYGLAKKISECLYRIITYTAGSMDRLEAIRMSS